MAFALLGALIFALFIAPVLCQLPLQPRNQGVAQSSPRMAESPDGRSLDWCFDHMKLTLGMGLLALGVMIFMATSGIIGSEFLPHLDEGAIWVRGTLAPSTGPSASITMSKQARLVLADFPEDEAGGSTRSDAPTTDPIRRLPEYEFFVDLRPRQVVPQFHEKKDEVIAAMDKKLQQFPGVN